MQKFATFIVIIDPLLDGGPSFNCSLKSDEPHHTTPATSSYLHRPTCPAITSLTAPTLSTTHLQVPQLSASQVGSDHTIQLHCLYRHGSRSVKPDFLSRQFTSTQGVSTSPEHILPPSCVVGAITPIYGPRCTTDRARSRHRPSQWAGRAGQPGAGDCTMLRGII